MINIENKSTWPEDILLFMHEHYRGFIGWECEGEYPSSGPSYDQLVGSLSEILKKYSMRGFHCTKLTVDEILNIETHGLALQNKRTLSNRINILLNSGQISQDIANSLLNENQSDDRNRANMLWFCFYAPRLAGRHGIERFFMHWGGEALYNSHETNAVTSPILQEIGIPCIVEALVPFQSMPDIQLPFGQFTRSFLKDQGYKLENELTFEAYITAHLPPTQIIEIHQYPSKSFLELSDCANWDVPIATFSNRH